VPQEVAPTETGECRCTLGTVKNVLRLCLQSAQPYTFAPLGGPGREILANVPREGRFRRLRGAPQRGFAADIVRIRVRIS
jgi:hypothetical protein